MAGLFLICLWLPIFSLLLGSLWIQKQNTYWIQRQKSLDQCVYKIQSQRCFGLTNISKINSKLRQLIQAASAASAAQVIPAMAPASRIALQSLKALAQFYAKAQDLLVMEDDVLITSFFKCGILAAKPTPRHLQSNLMRTHHIQAQMLKMPAPLAWRTPGSTPATATAFHVFDWREKTFQSFGSCQTQALATLTGEAYDPVFIKNQAPRGKHFWNWPLSAH